MKKNTFTNNIAALILFSSSSQVYCESQTQTAEAQQEKTWLQEHGLSMEFGLIHAVAPSYFEDKTKENSTSAQFSIGYQISEKMSASVLIGATKAFDNYGGNSFSADDSSYSFVMPKIVELGIWGNLTWSSSLTYGNSELSKMTDLKATLTTSLGWSKVINKVSLGLSSGVSKLFYKYTLNEEGEANKNYVVSNAMSLGYTFDKYFSLAYRFAYSNNYYHYGKIRDSYASTASISYDMIPTKLGFSLGVLTRHSFKNEREVRINTYKFYIEEKTSVFASASYSL